MAIITTTKRIRHVQRNVEPEIICTFCKKPMRTSDIYSKKHSKDWMFGKFEGSIAECVSGCMQGNDRLVFYSYDMDSVREKVKRFDTSK